MRYVQCFLTSSSWYAGAVTGSTPIGILWHDTGAGNPNVARYVQPADDDPNREELINILGYNRYKNDWNHKARQAGVNAFIGKFADGEVGTVQTGTYDMHPWGCASGANGSCNGYYTINGKSYVADEHWVQFEICDDSYQDEEYFEKVYKEAVEFTAYICKEYNIDPKGTVYFGTQEVPTILCHRDSYSLGLGSGHADVLTWFGKMGKTMEDVRNDVAELLKPEPAQEFELLDEVKIKDGVTTYASGKQIASWVFNARLYVRAVRQNGLVTVSTLKEGAVTGTLHDYDLILVKKHEDADADSYCEAPVDAIARKINLISSPDLFRYIDEIEDDFDLDPTAVEHILSAKEIESDELTVVEDEMQDDTVVRRSNIFVKLYFKLRKLAHKLKEYFNK